MAPRLLLAIYGLLFFSYILAAIFIAFHLLRYSFNKKLASSVVFLFLAATGVLIIANAAIFLSIPWNKLFLSVGISF